MSLSDALSFEKFAFKDIWGKIKEEPMALLVGGLDPIGAEFWKKLGVLDEDYEPAVNALGGPFGSGDLGLGDTGGVWKRAQAEGIDTDSALGMHNLAEMISGSYALGGLGGLVGGGLGGAEGSAIGQQVGPQIPGLLGGGQQMPQNNAAVEAQQREAQKRMSLLNRRRGI